MTRNDDWDLSGVNRNLDREGREDDYETPAKELEPLPEDNDEDYPQENAAYFRNKKYVRTDKFPLSELAFEGLELPSIATAFPSNNNH